MSKNLLKFCTTISGSDDFMTVKTIIIFILAPYYGQFSCPPPVLCKSPKGIFSIVNVIQFV